MICFIATGESYIIEGLEIRGIEQELEEIIDQRLKSEHLGSSLVMYRLS